MMCPICNGKTEVTDSRERKFGVWRRRKCLECGTRFSTQEVLSLNAREASVQMGKIKAHFKKLQASLNGLADLLEANDES